MTKQDIVRTISEEEGLTQQQAKKIVQRTFNALIDCLVNERRVELRNFGVFEVKQRAARRARNPRTGKKVDVPAKYTVTFRPGKEMDVRLRELDKQDSAGTDGQTTPPGWVKPENPLPIRPEPDPFGSSESP